MQTLTAIQDQIIQQIKNDCNPMFQGMSFSYLWDWYRAAISNLGYTYDQAVVAVKDAEDMAVLELGEA